ncbi:MAG: hypothetical protein ACYDDF_00190 [Thermoplasmatota archaeon]
MAVRSHARIAIILTAGFVALALSPVARAMTAVVGTTDGAGNGKTKFYLGDTVTFQAKVSAGNAETITFYNLIDLCYNPSPQTSSNCLFYGSIGNGAANTVSPGMTTTVTVSFVSPTASSYAGVWQGTWQIGSQVYTVSFDLSYGSDIVLTYMRVNNASLLLQDSFAVDRTHKMIDGCIEDIGNGAPAQETVAVALWYKTPIDPLLSWGNHIAQVSNFQIGWPAKYCADMGINANGYYVHFDWYAETSPSVQEALMYQIGLQANYGGAIWELDGRHDTNDGRWEQATLQPIEYLGLP